MIYKSKTWFLIALFSLPLVIFFVFFFRFALNIPFEDDLGIVHTLAVELPKALTFREKFSTFIMAHNEHPINVFRFFLWVYHAIFQDYNFKIIALIGNLILLSSIFYFFRQLRIIKLSWIWLIPIPYIILSLYIHENALWALCAFQHNAIMGLYFWGLYGCIVHKNPSPRFFGGIFLIICTSVCSGNGLLGFLIVIAILLFEKRWKDGLIVGATFILVKLILLNNHYYQEPSPLPQIIKGFFLLCGSIIKVSSKDLMIMLLGMGITICIIIAGLRILFGKLNEKERTYYLLTLGISLFCLGTFVGIAVYRDVVSSAFSDRYRIYTQMLWISIYLFSIPLIIKFNFQRILYPAILSLSIGYFCYSYYVEYPNFVYSYQQRWLIPVNYRFGGTNLSGCYYRVYFDETLKTLEKEQSYQIPKPKFDPHQIEKTKQIFNLKAEKLNDEMVHLYADEGSIEGNPDDNSLFITLENAKGTQLFLPVVHKRNTISGFLQTKKLLKEGFEMTIAKGCLPDDFYKVMLVKQNNRKAQLYATNLVLDSQRFTIIETAKF